MKSSYFIFYTFFIRLVIIYAFGASSYLFTRFFGPSYTGFFCDDNSIKLPYRDSTVEIAVLLIILYSLLFLTILIVEPICHNLYYSKISSPNGSIQKLGRVAIHPVVPRALEIFVISQLGFIITIFFFNYTKFCASRLRPNFVATCQPNISWDDCKPGMFIQEYECLNENKYRAGESRLSFYSGHTAESFYYAVFLILYIHAKIGRKFCSSILLPILYVLLISSAIFVGGSRIMDNKHFPSDVLFGAFMGTATAILIVYYYRHIIFDISYDFMGQDSTKMASKVPISIDEADQPVIVNANGEELLHCTKRNMIQMQP